VDCQYCQGTGARFRSSDNEESAKISRALRGHVTFQKGELIESELQRASFAYVISQGMAHAFTQLPDGRRQILRYLYPGDLATSLHPQDSAMRIRVRCLTDVRACQYDAALLRAAIYARGDLLSHLMADCLAIMAAQDEQILSVGARTSEEALAHFVLMHFRRQLGSKPTEGEVLFPMRLSDIADTVGVTEVHAGRLMRRLEAEGLVERRSSNLLFVNRRALEAFAG